MKIVMVVKYESDTNWEIFNPKLQHVHNNSNLTWDGYTHWSFKSYSLNCPNLLPFFRRMKYENTDDN
jgi:hypothetical protein